LGQDHLPTAVRAWQGTFLAFLGHKKRETFLGSTPKKSTATKKSPVRSHGGTKKSPPQQQFSRIPPKLAKLLFGV
jgi:hypothetical protein